MAPRWLRTLLLLAILLLGRPLAVLPLGTDGGATSSDEKGEALAARLRRLLDGVRDVGQQLRSTGGAWLAARADALDAAASEGEFRGPLAFAGQRLREELRQRCSKPSFTPPTDRPATVAGPGVSLALTTGGCRLTRTATGVRRDLVLACTDPGETVTVTQPRYTAAYTTGGTFRGAECKVDFQYGPAASLSIDLWVPGLTPPDVAEAWAQRLQRWQAQAQKRRDAAAAAGSDAETSGGDWAGRAGGGGWAPRGGDLGALRAMNGAVAAALRAALERNGGPLRKALAAWSQANGPGGGTAAAHSTSAAAAALRSALAGLLADLDLRGQPATERFLSQLQSAPDPSSEGAGAKGGWERVFGPPRGWAAAGDGGEVDAAGGWGPWEGAANVSDVFEKVGRAGLRRMGAAGLGGDALRVGVEGAVGADAAAESDGQAGLVEEGACSGEGSGVMRGLAAEVERLLRLAGMKQE